MDRRGLSKLILQLLVKFNPPGMHYSFGDREGLVAYFELERRCKLR